LHRQAERGSWCKSHLQCCSAWTRCPGCPPVRVQQLYRTLECTVIVWVLLAFRVIHAHSLCKCYILSVIV
jgi:hypothetical protein